MGSTTLNSSRDQLYTQWQRDVADARKARSAILAQQQSGEMAQLEAKIAGEKDIAKAGTNHDLEVARLKTQAEKELEAMRIEASSDELGRKINAESENAYQADRRRRWLFDWENRPGTVNERDVRAKEFLAGAKGERQPMYKVDELATFLSEATTDDESGKPRSISSANRAVLEEMAEQGGYKVVYPDVGPKGRPYIYSHQGPLGEYETDKDIARNNNIRFQRVAKPDEVMRKLR